MATSIVFPPLAQLMLKDKIEFVDLLDDEESKEANYEKELKEIFKHKDIELAFVRIKAKQSLISFHAIHKYDVNLDIVLPPPRRIG